jgi:antitoxin component of MazEF toxin-antitoxin module
MTSLAKIRRIGNSKGILFPKTILEQSGIKSMVRITVKDHVIMITSADQPTKKKWSDFKKAGKVKADFALNRFDEAEWTW